MLSKTELHQWIYDHHKHLHNPLFRSKLIALVLGNSLFIIGNTLYLINPESRTAPASVHMTGAALFFTGGVLGIIDVIIGRIAMRFAQQHLPVTEKLLLMSSCIFFMGTIFFVAATAMFFSPPGIIISIAELLGMLGGASLFLSYFLQYLIAIFDTAATSHEPLSWPTKLSQWINIAGDTQLYVGGVFLVVCFASLLGNHFDIGNGLGIVGRSLLITGQSCKVTKEYDLLTRAAKLTNFSVKPAPISPITPITPLTTPTAAPPPIELRVQLPAT